MGLKIAIVGAGAIGGYLGVKLALSGHDVTFVARGENLSQVAHAIGVSYKTVANACALIKTKLGARTTADLVRIGVEQGLA